jgi:hypothetical protein
MQKYHTGGNIMITEQEREIIRQEIKAEILASNRAYKMEWRAKNKDKVKESNRRYYEKKKAQEVDDR